MRTRHLQHKPGYSVERHWEHGWPVFAVVSPSGESMYWHATRSAAEADAAVFNARSGRDGAPLRGAHL